MNHQAKPFQSNAVHSFPWPRTSPSHETHQELNGILYQRATQWRDLSTLTTLIRLPTNNAMPNNGTASITAMHAVPYASCQSHNNLSEQILFDQGLVIVGDSNGNVHVVSPHGSGLLGQSTRRHAATTFLTSYYYNIKSQRSSIAHDVLIILSGHADGRLIMHTLSQQTCSSTHLALHSIELDHITSTDSFNAWNQNNTINSTAHSYTSSTSKSITDMLIIESNTPRNGRSKSHGATRRGIPYKTHRQTVSVGVMTADGSVYHGKIYHSTLPERVTDSKKRTAMPLGQTVLMPLYESQIASIYEEHNACTETKTLPPSQVDQTIPCSNDAAKKCVVVVGMKQHGNGVHVLFDDGSFQWTSLHGRPLKVRHGGTNSRTSHSHKGRSAKRFICGGLRALPHMPATNKQCSTAAADDDDGSTKRPSCNTTDYHDTERIMRTWRCDQGSASSSWYGITSHNRFVIITHDKTSILLRDHSKKGKETSRTMEENQGRKNDAIDRSVCWIQSMEGIEEENNNSKTPRRFDTIASILPGYAIVTTKKSLSIKPVAPLFTMKPVMNYFTASALTSKQGSRNGDDDDDFVTIMIVNTTEHGGLSDWLLNSKSAVRSDRAQSRVVPSTRVVVKQSLSDMVRECKKKLLGSPSSMQFRETMSEESPLVAATPLLYARPPLQMNSNVLIAVQLGADTIALYSSFLPYDEAHTKKKEHSFSFPQIPIVGLLQPLFVIGAVALAVQRVNMGKRKAAALEYMRSRKEGLPSPLFNSDLMMHSSGRRGHALNSFGGGRYGDDDDDNDNGQRDYQNAMRHALYQEYQQSKEFDHDTDDVYSSDDDAQLDRPFYEYKVPFQATSPPSARQRRVSQYDSLRATRAVPLSPISIPQTNNRYDQLESEYDDDEDGHDDGARGVSARQRSVIDFAPMIA